ncbi:MAG: transglycosylase SLT domain-containing protein [Proteobacteria bacterium]|nr:transglycosylase SLT domain-containing protein [Pseudomonadota bacterium]MBU1648390.1 transglycosylase SLT domain-containing protein [Pseudomonadota bacterium]MBU1986917.1 transglycosylase SLT domain-containing protein [Pseudomonadota bacterium]
MQRLIQSFLLLCILITTAPSPANAATVELPLFLRTQILQNALVESLTPQPDRPTVLFQEGSYNYLHISEPQLSIRDGQPYFSCNATAGMGFDSLGLLPSVVKWSGSILMRLNFYVDPQWQLRYRIIDSAIYNEKGGKPVVTGFAWELCKRFLHPRLEQYAFDLAMPQKEIMILLRACASPTDTAPLEAALNTLTVGTLRTNADGLIVPLLLTVADTQTQTVAPLPAQAPLGFEELEKLQHVFEPLDAFMVFVIKSLSGNMGNSLHQEQLFDLLITSRYQLLMILTGQTPVEAEDPLRLLFIDAWQQLRPIIESSSGENGLMQKQLLRFMTFINAGDALLALDAAAPGLGIHVTSNGLRRLARMLQPGTGEDPLRFDWQIDPALRDLFQFQPEEPEQKTQEALPELPPELLQQNPPAELPAEPPQQKTPVEFPPETPQQKPPAEFPPETPQQKPPAEFPPETPQSSTTGRRLLDFLVGVAYATEPPAPALTNSNKRLDNWIPSSDELDEYKQIIEKLLATSALRQVKKANLDPRYATIYQHLIPATAMIESCWQQFTRKDDKIITLRSPAGGIGIMQINQHVWRGFYDIERLQRDVTYNIQAGNQIMMRYFQQYGIQIAKEKNNPHLAARAAYATYNAGPRASRRFLKAEASVRQKRVDEHLWDLYQKVSAGGSADLQNCSIL